MRVRPARAYQHPNAPIRRMADKAIRSVARGVLQSLMVTRRRFDKAKAAEFLRQDRPDKVLDLLDLHHQSEALRRPLGLLGNLWLEGAALGARKINGAFAAKGRRVRYKKAATLTASSGEPRRGGGRLTVFGRSEQIDRASADRPATPYVDLEDYLLKVSVAKDQADQFDFNRFDPGTMALIQMYQQALLAQLTSDIRATVSSIILDGLQSGEDIDVIVDSIRAIIGLTPAQARAVENFRLALLADLPVTDRALLDAIDLAAIRGLKPGEKLSHDQIDDATDRYAANYLAYRATTIAQTETTRAASLGLQSSYQQAVDRGVMPADAVTQFWQIALDEKVCPICLSVFDRNPDGVPLGQPFDSIEGPYDAPPAHPNCRCSLEFVTNLDMVPDDFGEELSKFDPNEARDDHGRWTAGGATTEEPAKRTKWGDTDVDQLTSAQITYLARTWSVDADWENYQIAARAVADGVTRDEFMEAHGGDDAGREFAGSLYDKTATTMAAINNGPDVGLPLYRGISDGSNYKVGDTFSESLSSWTGDQKLAQDFATGKFHDRGEHAFGAVRMAPAVFEEAVSNNSKGILLSDHVKSDWFESPVKYQLFHDAQEYLTTGQYRVTKVTEGAKFGDLRTITVERVGPAKIVDIKKFDENEPRDSRGRWTVGGAGGGIPIPVRGAGREFFSGNTEDLDLASAEEALHSPEQAHVEAMSHDVDQTLGLNTHDDPVIGAWEDGAENSVMTTVSGGSWEDLRLSAAMKGSLANQKAVLAFREGEGSDDLVTFEAKGSLGDIHSAMLADGLAFHTLVPTSGGAHVIVVASDDDTRNSIDKAASRYGSQVSYRPGQAEFIGVGGDGSREDAQQIYASVIEGSGMEGVAAKWDGLRDRWGSVAKVFRQIVKAWFAPAEAEAA